MEGRRQTRIMVTAVVYLATLASIFLYFFLTTGLQSGSIFIAVPAAAVVAAIAYWIAPKFL